MALTINPPNIISYETVDSTSVRVRWRPVVGASAYYIRSIGSEIQRRVTDNETVIKGLLPARTVSMELRSERDNGVLSGWQTFNVRPSVSIEPAPEDVPVVPIIDADRQSVQLRLPRPDGTNVNVRLHLWWQTSDKGWWASIEVPTNFPVVSSKRLAVNTGIFDHAKGFLDGNIVMRATGDDMELEPTRRAFADRTHELRWEPVSGG